MRLVVATLAASLLWVGQAGSQQRNQANPKAANPPPQQNLRPAEQNAQQPPPNPLAACCCCGVFGVVAAAVVTLAVLGKLAFLTPVFFGLFGSRPLRFCDICGVPIKRTSYVWDTRDGDVEVCPHCNRTMEQRKSYRSGRRKGFW